MAGDNEHDVGGDLGSGPGEKTRIHDNQEVTPKQRVRQMNNAFEKLLQIVQRLAGQRIWYKLRYHRDDAMTIEVGVPGERWEIDVLIDGSVDIEVFKSDGRIYDEPKLEEIFQRFSE